MTTELTNIVPTINTILFTCKLNGDDIQNMSGIRCIYTKTSGIADTYESYIDIGIVNQNVTSMDVNVYLTNLLPSTGYTIKLKWKHKDTGIFTTIYKKNSSSEEFTQEINTNIASTNPLFNPDKSVTISSPLTINDDGQTFDQYNIVVGSLKGLKHDIVRINSMTQDDYTNTINIGNENVLVKGLLTNTGALNYFTSKKDLIDDSNNLIKNELLLNSINQTDISLIEPNKGTYTNVLIENTKNKSYSITDTNRIVQSIINLFPFKKIGNDSNLPLNTVFDYNSNKTETTTQIISNNRTVSTPVGRQFIPIIGLMGRVGESGINPNSNSDKRTFKTPYTLTPLYGLLSSKCNKEFIRLNYGTVRIYHNLASTYGSSSNGFKYMVFTSPYDGTTNHHDSGMDIITPYNFNDNYFDVVIYSASTYQPVDRAFTFMMVLLEYPF